MKTPLFHAYTLSALLMTQTACAAQSSSPAESVLLNNQDNSYAHWNGIGKLFKDGEPLCTATLLDTRDTDNNSVGPAYLLTAGHCVSYDPGPSTDEPFDGAVVFNYFNDTPDEHHRYDVEKATWNSMVGTDIAILQLKAPLATLIEDGITPIKLSTQASAAVGGIQIVGAPHAFAESGLRLATCNQAPTDAALVESIGTFANTLKNHCAGIGQGSSGSPVIEPATGEITSVLFTSTNEATVDTLCFWNTPCEVKNGQPTLATNAQYSHSVEYLADCFVSGTFNSRLNSCALNTSFNLNPERFGFADYAYTPKEHEKTPVWKLTFSPDTPFYHYKSVNDARSCYLPAGYSAATDSHDAEIDSVMGREPGIYSLCIVGTDTAQERPDAAALKHTKILSAQLVDDAPARMPEVTVTPIEAGGYQVEVRRGDPHFTQNRYQIAAADDTRCEQTERKDYRWFTSLTLTPEQLPLTLCTFAINRAGKASATRIDLLPQH
jgi:hypothetical protein